MKHKHHTPGKNRDADRLFIPVRNEKLQKDIIDYKARTGKSYEQIMAECLILPVDNLELLQNKLKDARDLTIRMSDLHDVSDIELMFSNIQTALSLCIQRKLSIKTLSECIVNTISDNVK